MAARTEDYEKTVVDLLTSPYLRYRGRISYGTVQEVVGLIDLFNGVTPELAAKVLLNGALLREVAHAEDEESRQR